LVAAVARLLKPLVRLLLSRQFTYPMLIRLLKTVYVEVADSDFRVTGREQTESRVSLLTGVHRKDVKRIRAKLPTSEKVPQVVSLGAQLVAIWTTDPRFLGEDGRSRPLPRLPVAGEKGSFEGLVRMVKTDIRPRVVVDEWLRLGVAHLDENDRMHLITDAFVPEKGFDEKAHYLGQNIHDHLAACTHNLLGGSPTMLERSVFSDALSEASVAELDRLTQEKAMELLQAIGRRAIELDRRDEGATTPKQRINFGVYFYTEPTHKPSEAPSREDNP
jgi:hypothetical protein